MRVIALGSSSGKRICGGLLESRPWPSLKCGPNIAAMTLDAKLSTLEETKSCCCSASEFSLVSVPTTTKITSPFGSIPTGTIDVERLTEEVMMNSDANKFLKRREERHIRKPAMKDENHVEVS